MSKRVKRLRRASVPVVLVGTDIIDVRSVADSIRQFGERYLGRVFTAGERAYCSSVETAGGDSAPHYAARFAAKEAVRKVLRPSTGDGIAWSSIEIVRSEGGACAVRLHGEARALVRRDRVLGLAVSLSHEREFATAVAIAQRARTRRPRPAAERAARRGA